MKKILWSVLAVGVAFGCSQIIDTDSESEDNDSEAGFEELPPTIGAAINGETGFCTFTSKCSSGQGDCNKDQQCQTGLICAQDVGSFYGFAPVVDVCVPAHCDDGEQSGDEEGVDCGGADCGLCPTCPADNMNGAGDFCSAECKCTSGQGDCDTNKQCATGLVCGLDLGLFYGMPNTTDVCVASHCANNVLDADEDQVDCGGNDCGACLTKMLPVGDLAFCTPQSPCTNGQGDCDNDAGCVPGSRCVLNVGATYGFPAYIDVCVSSGTVATCNDGMQNQGETGVDCGGQCAACTSCEDGIQNGNETSVDCGGSCGACATCDDGIMNQDETDIDCGGTNCAACQSCTDGILNQNETDIDCGGVCDACPTCDDNIQNQGESDVDCGGPCTACPNCEDGIQNQGEEDIDCGGPCDACGGQTGELGDACSGNASCQSNICSEYANSTDSSNGVCVSDMSCVGNCGGPGNAAETCYCDNLCQDYGDCCSDKIELCGDSNNI